MEIHFDEKDWQKHGHSRPAYEKVILHVVLYPPKDKVKGSASNRKDKIPTFVLLPYLLKSIEEYAEEDAMEKLSGIFPNLPPSLNHFPEDWKEAREWRKRDGYKNACMPKKE